MTSQEKNNIMQLRVRGYGYKRIAKELSMSVSTVRYVCGQMKNIEITEACMNCGAVIPSVLHKKAKKFCSDRCGWEWHNAKRRKKCNGPKNS